MALDILSSVASILCAIVMFVTFAALIARYGLEAWLPGVALGTVVDRLLSGRSMPEPLNADGEVSIANSRLRSRLKRNEFAPYKQLKLCGWLLAMLTLSRLLIFATALMGFWASGELDSFLSGNGFVDYWVRWDAPHYISLAEDWYVNTGDARYHIVFFPLYPLLVRVFRTLFFGNTVLAATVISNACLLAAAWALYRLVVEELGERAAKRAVRLLMFSPLAVFFSTPYAESLFFMLTLLAVLCARRRYFLPAVLLGALASATRLLGLVVAIPIYLEMLKAARVERPPRAGLGKYLRRVAGYTLLTCGVGLGFAAYLLLNQLVTGAPFTFLSYQAEHWSQQFGSIWSSVGYTLEYALTYDSPFWRLGVWIPQLIAMLLALALLVISCLKVYPGDGAYMWMYMFAALAPTWLLSGPRYLAAMYPVYIALPTICKSRVGNYIMLGVSGALMILCSYMYAVIGNLL